VKLIADLGTGVASETEVARIERHDFADLETVGLTLDDGKRRRRHMGLVVIAPRLSTCGSSPSIADAASQAPGPKREVIRSLSGGRRLTGKLTSFDPTRALGGQVRIAV
jgi:hypothetical protein